MVDICELIAASLMFDQIYCGVEQPTVLYAVLTLTVILNLFVSVCCAHFCYILFRGRLGFVDRMNR